MWPTFAAAQESTRAGNGVLPQDERIAMTRSGHGQNSVGQVFANRAFGGGVEPGVNRRPPFVQDLTKHLHGRAVKRRLL